MAQPERPVVVVLESIHPAGIDLLERCCEVHVLSGPQDPDLARLLEIADGLIVRSTRTGAEVLAPAARLRVIGRHGAGLDNVDLDFANSRDIRVVNTPRSNTESVAEYVITVAMMMLKRIPEVSRELRAGSFTVAGGSLPGQVDRAGLNGREAMGLVLGLVGAGGIGRSVAWRAQALGMRVVAYDPFVSAATMEGFGMEPVETLEDLLSSVDMVSLHIPGGGDNAALIGAEQIAMMRRGSWLINAARGDLIDTVAIAAAVASGHLAGAAIDVFEPEPPAPDHPIFRQDNIIATPHMAAMTHEALERMSVDVATAVIGALSP
jgi:D-3-phosphoglycerate dehydrogenase